LAALVRRISLVARAGRRFGGEAEVHLFFGGIDFGDLDGDIVAEADDAAAAAADQVIAVGLKDIEIVFNGGEWYEAAHDKAGDIDEEAEIADLGDECGVVFGLAGFELGLEEGEEFHVP